MGDNRGYAGIVTTYCGTLFCLWGEVLAQLGPSRNGRIVRVSGLHPVADASRAFDLPPSEIEGWMDDAKSGMENALRANPLDMREQ